MSTTTITLTFSVDTARLTAAGIGDLDSGELDRIKDLLLTAIADYRDGGDVPLGPGWALAMVDALLADPSEPWSPFPPETPTTVDGWSAAVDRLLAADVVEPLRSAALAAIAGMIGGTAWHTYTRPAARVVASRARAAICPVADLLAGTEALIAAGHLSIGGGR